MGSVNCSSHGSTHNTPAHSIPTTMPELGTKPTAEAALLKRKATTYRSILMRPAGLKRILTDSSNSQLSRSTSYPVRPTPDSADSSNHLVETLTHPTYHFKHALSCFDQISPVAFSKIVQLWLLPCLQDMDRWH